MAIEFRCTLCGKLLRTGDETAGKQAKCPVCGALTTIPQPTETGERQVPPLAPLGAEIPPPPPPAPGSPFGPGAETGGTRGPEGPYQSPRPYSYQVPPGQVELLAAQRVSGPATALIVTAILSIVLHSLRVLLLVAQVALPNLMRARGPQVFPMPGLDLSPEVLAGIGLVSAVVGLAMAVLILFGALKMKRLESYAMAMTSAIVAMIPCVSPCCLLGLPFGIWALVALSDGSIREAFRS